jgi:endonuclease/exonuclease/phosphatase family metal-dependent hydrolase
MQFSLATYNVNYGMPGHPRTLAAIRALDVDALFLQETTPEWQRALGDGIYRHWKPGRAGGQALLTRLPVEREEILDAPTGWFPAWRVAFANLQVLAVHLRPAFSLASGFHRDFFATGRVRKREIETFLKSLDPGLPTVVLGDFNEADGAALETLRARGYRQADATAHTWRFLHWKRRYDHVLAGPGVHVTATAVVDAGASDHLPLVCRVRVGS